MKQLYKNYKLGLGLLLIGALTGNHAAAQAAGTRLYATAYYGSNNNALYLQDSARYFYTGSSSRPDSTLNFQTIISTPKLFTRHLFTYNANGVIIRDEEQKWEPTVGIYRGYKRYDYKVNSAGVVTEELYQPWSISNYVYENGTKKIFKLDSLNRQIEETDQIWDAADSKWNNSEHYLISYNAAGMKTFVNKQTWSTGTNEWVDVYADGSYYDPSGLHLMSYYRYLWDTAGLAWKVNKGQFNTLDGAGRVVLSVFDNYNNGWHHVSRDSFTYVGSSTDIASRTEQRWNNATGMYDNYQREDFTYLVPGKLLTAYGWSWVAGTWDIGPVSYKKINYYESFSTGIGTQTAASSDMHIYPNPSKGMLFINIALPSQQEIALSLVDMQGKVVRLQLEGSVKEVNTSIDVSGIPAGNYSLGIKGSSGFTINRLVSVVH